MTEPVVVVHVHTKACGTDALGSHHVHSQSCSAEVCGRDAVFICGEPVCIRARRRDEKIRVQCAGHRLPSRRALVEHALKRKGLSVSAEPGTPLEEDEPVQNTWSPT